MCRDEQTNGKLLEIKESCFWRNYNEKSFENFPSKFWFFFWKFSKYFLLDFQWKKLANFSSKVVEIFLEI